MNKDINIKSKGRNYVFLFSLFAFMMVSLPSFAQDDCGTATSIGTLPDPANCGAAPAQDGSGTPVVTSGTNVGATAESPYTSVVNCQGSGTDMASPADDVWFSFVASANELDIDITGALANPNVAIYEGTCGALVPRGCNVGTGGNVTMTLNATTPGVTYYIQVSGGAAGEQGTFDLTLTNYNDCSACMQANSITANPAPINGTYQAGETVTFCYTVDDYTQISANWLLGIVPSFGAGWDMSTLVASGAPTGSDGAGTWVWDCGGVTSTATGLTINDCGWYYDRDSDGNPGNNYGDSNSGPFTFCWEITTLPTGTCVEGADLSVTVDNYADGELGSWSSIACQGDPSFVFASSLTCCPVPTIASTPISCFGASDGTITATGLGANPWDYVWTNSGGGTIQTTNNENGPDTVTGLAPDTYTVEVTDDNGCTTSVDIVISAPACPTISFAAPPADVTVQCIGDVPAMTNLTWTDTCANTAAVAGSDGALAGGACGGTITRTWTYTNGCGNTDTATQTITINDTTAPVLAAEPGDVTVQCIGDVPAMVNLAYTDNCDPAGSVAGSDGALVGGSCGGTITRTWTFTDTCGNTDTATQTITINDTTAPVLAAEPGDVTVQCIGDVPAMVNLAYTDNCDPAGSVAGSDGALVGGSCGGTITRTWTFTDTCGNTDTATQTITINDTTAPVLAAEPGDVTVQCIGDVPAMVNLAYTDNCDPAGSVAGSDGALVGGSCGGTITRTWTFTDTCGNTDTATQTITINDTTAPVLAAEPGDVTVQCIGDVPAMVNLAYTDNCDPAGSVAGSDGALVGGSCGGTITRTWTFTDACGNTDTATQTITINDTTAPVLAAEPGDVTVQCIGDVPAMVNLAYTDNCDPAGSVAGSDGALVGGSCGGTITRTWTFTDTCGNTDTATQTITVDDTTNPTASNPAGQTGTPPAPDVTVVTDAADNCGIPTVAWVSDVSDMGTCPEIITRTYSVTDACLNTINVTQTFTIGDAVLPTASNPLPASYQCSADVLGPDVTVVTDEADNGATPTVTWEDDTSDMATCPETITRRYRVTDDCGNFIFVSQTITVHDTIAPVLAAAPADVTVECIGDVPAMVDLGYTDNCDAAGTVTGSDSAIAGGNCGGTITRTWTFTDSCGNVDTVTQTITVDDTIAPVLAAAPADVTVECIGDVPAMVDLGYTDNCDAAGTVTGSDSAIAGGNCGGTITRTWTFTDSCGNVDTVTQTITVDDTIAPVMAAAPADVTVECIGDVPAMVDLGYTDNCDAAGTVTGSDTAIAGGNCGGTITRTWTYTDSCGNVDTVTQTITVDDTIDPTASNPADTTVPGGPVPPVDVTVVIDEADNCTVNPIVAFVSESTAGTCPTVTTRIYSVTDDCGNTINVTHLIYVTDPIVPTASNPLPASYQCSADVLGPDVTVVTDEADNGATPTVTWEDDSSDGLSCPETISRRYRVTDDCGNFIFVTQTITVHDTIAPVLAAAPADVTVECIGDVPAMVDLGYTDNCDAAGTVTGSDSAIAGGNCGGTITRTWTFTDSCGNVDTVTQTITVDDTIAPVLAAAPADVTVECIGDVPAMVDLGYTDNCDAAGTVTGSDTAIAGGNCGGTITRTWTITDSCGNVDTVTQTITVDDTIAPVMAAAPADVTVECIGDVPAMVDLGYTDNCDAAGTVTGTDSAIAGGNCGGTITRTWTYTDSCGNVDTVTQTITVDDTIDPTASNPADTTVPGGPVPPVDVTVVIDEADNCTVNPVVAFVSESTAGTCPTVTTRIYSVTDDCGNTINVTHTIYVTDPIVPTASNPLPASYQCSADVLGPDITVVTDEADNGATPTVTWEDDTSDMATCPETITRRYRVTDDCGNFIFVSQTITVNDTIAPVLAAAPADVTVECIGDVPAMVDLGYTDNCDAAGTVTGTDAAIVGGNCGGTITRTWTITDSCGNVDTVIQTITVDDTIAPVLAAAPADVTVECIGDVPAMVDLGYTDNCDAAGTVTGTDAAIAGGNCGGTITRTWTITDSCGNVDTVTQTITVDDTIAPVMAAAPADVTVECIGDVPAMVDLGYTDNCDAAGTVTGTDAAIAGGNCGGTITRTWTITDSCGNVDTVTQTITVDDTIDPTASNPADTTVPGGPVPPVDVTVVIDEADNCTVNPVVAFVSESTAGTCPTVTTRIYSVTDDCGNTINVTHTIYVTDPIVPTASNPLPASYQCSADVLGPDVTVVTDEADNGATPTVTWEDDTSDGNTCPEIITRRYRVTDQCGNFIFVTQTITVHDTIAPVLAAAPADVTVECIGDVPAMVDLGYTDNCDAAGTVTGTDAAIVGGNCGGTITRTWTFTDSCGNVDTVTQTITVDDTIAPVLAVAPAAITVECIGDVPAMVDLGYTDNCDAAGTVTGTDAAIVGGNCGGTITRTWTITDTCGNTSTVTQTITVDDTIDPTASNPAQTDMPVGDPAPPVDINVVIDEADNCTVNPVVAFVSESSDGGSCPEVITRIYSVTDDCGNTINVTHTITTTTLPEFTGITTNTDICAEVDAEFYLVGTPNGIVTYTIDGGAPQNATLDGTGNGTVTVTTLAATTSVTIHVTNIQDGTTGCDLGVDFTETITVNPNPIANAIDDLEECDVDVNGNPDNDGSVVFDLNTNIGYLLNGQTGMTVSYFFTQGDADANINSLTSQGLDVNAYANTTNPQQIFVRVENDTTGCFSTTSFELIVNSLNAVIPNALTVCDDDNDTFGWFNLEDATAQIQNGNTNLVVTYYETEYQSQSGTGAHIDTTGLYQNVDTDGDGFGITQVVYIRVDDPTTGCYYLSPSFTLTLNVLDSPNLDEGELIYALCEDNGSADGYVEFDLMDYALNTLGLDPSFQIDFYTGLDASGNPIGYIPNFTSYTNVSTPDQVIYMTISNTNTDSNGNLCTTVRPITLHVDLLPNVPVFHEMYACDDDYFDEMDGIYPFDLEAEIFVITGGVTGLGITFHETFGEAEAGINPIPNPSVYENSISGADDVFARVFDESTGCYAITHIKLHVDANPTPLSTQNIIDQLGNDGRMVECDGDVDGSGSIAEQIAEFDLTLWETLILTGENGPGVETGVSASYYTSYDDADGGSNAIATPETYTNTSNPQTIYVRVTNDGSGVIPQTAGTGCYTIVQFDIFVPVPEVSVSGNTVLCVDENGVPLSSATLPVLEASPNSDEYDYQWALNGVDISGATNATYTATEPGEYTVTISGPTDFDCVNYASITVEESGMPANYDANVTTTAFSDNHQIQATATSSIPGVEFYYTLDYDVTIGEGVETNMTGLFTDVAPGLHYITITDGKGCWSDTVEVLVIDYPHFFTPNGDGVNDTWHIIGQEGIPISIIYIFDRYGKLLTQLDPDGAGWDGTYNGHAMPAGDYWFTIQYIEGQITPTEKEFKAHFSIKR